MPNPGSFPHLRLVYRGTFDPRYSGGYPVSDEVKANRQNPGQHAKKIRRGLDRLRQNDALIREGRIADGLPAIPADRGFLLRLPEGAPIDTIVRSLGVELVAETEAGFLLVSTSDLDFQKIRDILDKFERGEGGLVAASFLLEVYEQPDDNRRLKNILAPEVLALWPFDDASIYTFDMGIQTAASTRDVKWPNVRQRSDESIDDFLRRQNEEREKAWIAASAIWDESAEERVGELQELVTFYEGVILSGIISDPASQADDGMVFPDSVQVRVRMKGEGFRDVVLNFAHLFDLSQPPEVQQERPGGSKSKVGTGFELRAPAEHAASVCIIDSGIEEEHVWLKEAIDSDMSRCFVPGEDADDIADYVAPQGHGTRVAGAVLFPGAIPLTGIHEAVGWIQNARVLDRNNRLLDTLPPEIYLQQVVSHFHAEPYFTKIFNHSINADYPCPKSRMTPWAAKMDQLSHQHDVLFIQSAGNQSRHVGDASNPGLSDHLKAGKIPPAHQLQASMRVANPAQSLHALTVGSISESFYDARDMRSFASFEHGPSGFSRTGYGQPWSVVKPEVVEVGGDLIYSKSPPHTLRTLPHVAVELLNSTMHGAPAFSKDGTGTSFAAPKVAHIAAHLQNLFPNASPLLYRALIVQGARWPQWAENETDADKVLRLIGYGIPSLERSSMNSESRVTLIMPDAEVLPSKKLHLYTIPIPAELRNAATEARIRVDVTLAYTALPRRTRARRTGYLETWLDWEASKKGESNERFVERMEKGGNSSHRELPWVLHKGKTWGEADETCRNRGTVQKDWAIFDAFELPEEFSIAVRSHMGWNHLKGAGTARYCLVVSFEVVEGEVPIYALIEQEVQAEAQLEVTIE